MLVFCPDASLLFAFGLCPGLGVLCINIEWWETQVRLQVKTDIGHRCFMHIANSEWSPNFRIGWRSALGLDETIHLQWRLAFLSAGTSVHEFKEMITQDMSYMGHPMIHESICQFLAVCGAFTRPQNSFKSPVVLKVHSKPLSGFHIFPPQWLVLWLWDVWLLVYKLLAADLHKIDISNSIRMEKWVWIGNMHRGNTVTAWTRNVSSTCGNKDWLNKGPRKQLEKFHLHLTYSWAQNHLYTETCKITNNLQSTYLREEESRDVTTPCATAVWLLA